MSTIIAAESLPPVEAERLEHLEAVITDGMHTFIRVGEALAEIRDRRLYRVEHCTFEDYCRERWGWSRQHAYRQIQAAEVARQMSPLGDTVPATERVARALVPVPESERPRVWAEAQAAAKDEGREVVAADVERVWLFKAQPMLSAKSDEWYTPGNVIDAARSVLGGIDLDPASCEVANRMVRAPGYFTLEDDGLAQDWHGRIWLNPPFSSASRFAAKALAEYEAGHITAIVLLSAGAATSHWFHPLWDHVLCFSRGRLRFTREDGTPGGSNTAGSVLVYLGSDPARFAEVFSDFGAVVRRWS